MSFAEAAAYAARDLKPDIGTIFQTDIEALTDGRFARLLRELLDDRGVIVFPKIGMTDEQQIAFTKTLGTFAPEGQLTDGIYKVTKDSSIAPYAEYIGTSFYWHIDGTMHDVPIRASLLSARAVASTGGETEFANAYAAYEALSDEDKVAIEGLKAVHSFEAIQRCVIPEPSHAQLQQWRRHKTKTLPLVWKHKSGRRSLILGNTAHYVVGLSHEDSSDLLTRLRDHATQPQFVYRHTWSLGDLVLWDNTGTLHRAMPYSADSGRLMHRTKLEGEEVFA
jgi:alpha-ketoglutarate-dependent taurine dioxygenase